MQVDEVLKEKQPHAV